MRVKLLLLLLVSVCSAIAQDENYATGKIPATLLKNANAVLRNSHTEIRVVSGTDITVSERYAVTVLNEKGKRFGIFRQQYNKLVNLTSIHGRLYDRNGEEIKKLKKNDIKDLAAFDGTFHDEDRYKYYDFDCSDYPYTCVFEYEQVLRSAFFLHEWSPRPGYDCAVEKADMEMVCPVDFSFRHRTYHSDQQPTVLVEDGKTRITLAFSNISADPRPNGFSVEQNFSSPALAIVPDNISLEDIQGSMRSWSDFGKFFYDLNVNRDQLPETMRKVVHNLTDTCSGDQSKVAVLYNYLQKNTRYLNIVLGIGGWRTWDAAFVAQKGYGDCKALTNFMKAMLKEAGVTSYPALIWGGNPQKQMEADFADNVFNHVILCVPQKAGDTIWLECTSQDMPPGFLSSFTADRQALLISPSGGFPVYTPAYSSMDNSLRRTALINITTADEIEGSVTGIYKGYWWDSEKAVFGAGKTEVDDYMNKKYAIPSYEVLNYKLAGLIEGFIPVIHEQVALKGKGNISRSGDKLYVTPEVFRFAIAFPTSTEKRTTPFQLSQGFCVFDTVVLDLKGIYTMDMPPRQINTVLPFAVYRTRTFLEEGHLLKTETYFEQKAGKYNADLFVDYLKLAKDVNAGHERVILVTREK